MDRARVQLLRYTHIEMYRQDLHIKEQRIRIRVEMKIDIFHTYLHSTTF
jgi:hypothetical protein